MHVGFQLDMLPSLPGGRCASGLNRPTASLESLWCVDDRQTIIPKGAQSMAYWSILRLLILHIHGVHATWLFLLWMAASCNLILTISTVLLPSLNTNTFSCGLTTYDT